MNNEKNLLFTLSDSLVRKIYNSTLQFPYKYQSSLGDQLRRASLSIVLNIVEGGARKSTNEKRQFLNISFASLKETKYLVCFAKEFQLISQTDFDQIMTGINELARVLYGLLYKSKRYI